LPTFNISQMHDKLGCWFDGRVMGVVYDDSAHISGCSDPT